jgi:hypothetical protein
MAAMNPAFDRWFAGSVVTDPGGRPRVLYHGTRSPLDFETFEQGTQRGEDDAVLVSGSRDPGAYLGVHLAESAALASKFAEGRAADWDRARYVGSGAGGRVIPVYLAVRRPRVFGSERALLDFVYDHGTSHEVEAYLEMNDRLDDEGQAVDNEGRPLSAREAAELAFRLAQSDDEDDGFETIAFELGVSARNALLEQGYDGVRYANEVEHVRGASPWCWIALAPGSVKSAYGNRGTWNAEDPSLVHAYRRPGPRPLATRNAEMSRVRPRH